MKLTALITTLLVLGSSIAVTQDDLVQATQDVNDYTKLQEFYKAHSLINDMDTAQRDSQLMQAMKFYEYQRNQEMSQFWIGVQCVEADSTQVNSDLPIDGQLSYDGGLLVNSVTDNSPAAAAKIKVGDVIVTFNNEQTNEVIELVTAIAAAGEKECPVQVLRDGEFVELKVTPSKRGQEKDKSNNQDYLDDTRFLEDSRVALAKAWLSGGQLPKDIKLTISIENGNDVELRVQRGDKVWEVEDDNLDELPEDIQPYVGSMLNSIRTNSIYSPYRFAYPRVSWYPLVQPDALIRPRKALQPHYWNDSRSIGKRPTSLAKPTAEKDRIDELSNKIDELRQIIMELKQDD